MLYAVDGSEEKITATPGSRAKCPGCGGEVIAKCGSIVSHHWAHVAQECDSWHEPETEWHRGWKSLFPKECCEVTIGPHRADVKINGTVIEFQKSPISPEEIAEREAFYGDMIWVLDGSDFWERLSFFDGSEVKQCRMRNANHKSCQPSVLEYDKTYLPRGAGKRAYERAIDHIAFDWSHKRKSWDSATKPIYIHIPKSVIGPEKTFSASECLFLVTSMPEELQSPDKPHLAIPVNAKCTPCGSREYSSGWRGRFGVGQIVLKDVFVLEHTKQKSPHDDVPYFLAAEKTRAHIALLANQHLPNNSLQRYSYKTIGFITKSVACQYIAEATSGVRAPKWLWTWLEIVHFVLRWSVIDESWDYVWRTGWGSPPRLPTRRLGNQMRIVSEATDEIIDVLENRFGPIASCEKQQECNWERNKFSKWIPISRRDGPTSYKEINFDSGLEARWAAFFDLLGWKWRYKPDELAGWRPTFSIQGDFENVFVAVEQTDDFDHSGICLLPESVRGAIERSGCENDCLVVGTNPFPHEYEEDGLCLGWLGEYERSGGEGNFFWGAAVLSKWDHRFGFCHEYGKYTDRISGIHNKFPCGLDADSSDCLRELWRIWAEAGIAVMAEENAQCPSAL